MDKLVDVVVSALQDLKAKEVKVLDLRSLENAVCEHFVVCHGTSSTHASSLAHAVQKEVKEVFGTKPWKKEGFGNNSWVILDYSSVVVHVFLEETRHFYNIEDLWADAEITEFETEN